LVIISCAVEAVPEERFSPIVDVVRQVEVRDSIVSDTVKSFGKVNSYNDDKRVKIILIKRQPNYWLLGGINIIVLGGQSI